MATWKEDIVQALKNLGGKAHLSAIYKEVERIRGKNNLNPTWDRTVQRELESHSSDSDAYLKKDDLFYMAEGKGKGVWGLRETIKQPRFFLVYQGTTYKEEKELSCLWAPKFAKGGIEFHHHKRLVEVKKGDRVIHLVNRKIVAISTVKDKAYDAEAPWEQDKDKPWHKDGRKVDIDIVELDDPINVDDIYDKIKDYLPEKYSPFNKDGGGVQGYFFEIQANIFNIILNTDYTDYEKPEVLDFDNLKEPSGSSSVQSLKVNRRSTTWQKYFKNQLFKLWGVKCAVTNVMNKDLLIGAHIKPWSKCSDEEKIDPYNGLPLTPNADKLFEVGLISFLNNGAMIASKNLKPKDLYYLGIDEHTKLDIKEEHIKYLEYHRENKFQK